jgi:hypothetical protein
LAQNNDKSKGDAGYYMLQPKFVEIEILEEDRKQRHKDKTQI